MRYESAAPFRQALEQRLRDRAKATGASIVRLRKTVVFDRLLARLAVVLMFAGIDPIEVPVVPLEQQIAEKVHAYTRTYGGQPSSRARDLVDLVLIKQTAALAGARLHAALRGTFEGRRQHALPASLPPPPAEWSVSYRKLAMEVGLDTQLAAGHREAAALLDPVLAGLHSRRWDAEQGRWV